MGYRQRSAAAAVALTLVLILGLASLAINTVYLNLRSSSLSTPTTSEREVIHDTNAFGGGRAANKFADSGSDGTSGRAGSGNRARDGARAERHSGVDVGVGGGGGGSGAKSDGAPRWKGSGKKAYAVVFSDVGDPLVLERARALWSSLEEYDGDVVALIPRYTGDQLDAPLREIGYRVLSRDGPVPIWRTSGRWVQQTLTAIRKAGFRSDDGGGGGGDGDGGVREGGDSGSSNNNRYHESRSRLGWGLLGLEALSLTEYEEVVVLDQKMAILPAPAAETLSGSRTGGTWKRSGHRGLTGDGRGNPGAGGRTFSREGVALAETADPGLLPPQRLFGGGHDWAVAFAPGDGSILAPGEGVSQLPEGQRAAFSRQHPALMVVRPDAAQFEEISKLLCKGDAIFSGVYSDVPEESEENLEQQKREYLLDLRASTTPLLHLAVASLSRGGPSASAQLPLEICDGWAGGTGEALPIVWCPGRSSPEEPRQWEELRERGEEGEEEEGGRVGRQGGGLGGGVRLAWIPDDPCSCADAPGPVGEACLGWLRARSFGPRLNVEVSRGQGQERRHASALSSCKDGIFSSPLQAPPCAMEQPQPSLATATSNFYPRSKGADSGDVAAAAHPHIPWQDQKPADKAVVTEDDYKAFEHSWLVNVEKRLLVVAIPKVACTQIKALFLRLQGSDDWDTQTLWKIHFHKDQSKYDVNLMRDMSPERSSAILNDPSWTKAVFLRDPAERMLSCYLDKIVHIKKFRVNEFKTDRRLSFEKFVALTSKGAEERFKEEHPGANLGLTRKSNTHWRPQLYFGLEKFLPYFDFVGDFRHAEAHAEALLRRVGIWEEFGASGWGPNGDSSFFQSHTVQGHATGSHDAETYYLTPPLLSSVIEAYGTTDYKMMTDLGWWNQTAVLT